MLHYQNSSETKERRKVVTEPSVNLPRRLIRPSPHKASHHHQHCMGFPNEQAAPLSTKISNEWTRVMGRRSVSLCRPRQCCSHDTVTPHPYRPILIPLVKVTSVYSLIS